MTPRSYSSSEKHPGQTGLLVVRRLHPVQVERWLRFDNERSPVDQRLQIAGRQFVNGRAVWIDIGRQVDLGARHVEKAQRIVSRQAPGLAGGHHVVEDGGDGGSCRRYRAKCTERTNDGHDGLWFGADSHRNDRRRS